MTEPRQRFALLLATIATIATVSSGCTSTLSGVGGKGNYACKAPAGTMCTSVSGVYANSIHGPPPASALPKPAQKYVKGPTSAPPCATGASAPPAIPVLSTPASAIRSPPRVLRLWIAPWEDADGDLHEAAVVNVLVDTGRWLIERVRPAQRSKIDAVRPPAQSATPATAPAQRDAGPGAGHVLDPTGGPPDHGPVQEP